MPKLTKDKLQVTIGGFNDTDPNKFYYPDCIRLALMLFDTRFCSYDDEENKVIADGDIVVMDMQGMSFRHFFKVVAHLPTAKTYMHFLQEAAPLEIKQVNVVNPSAVIDRMFTLFRPFMKKEILDVLAFHRTLDTLHERVGKEYLPAKFGGTCDIDLDDSYENYIKKIEDFRYVSNVMKF